MKKELKEKLKSWIDTGLIADLLEEAAFSKECKGSEVSLKEIWLLACEKLPQIIHEAAERQYRVENPEKAEAENIKKLKELV